MRPLHRMRPGTAIRLYYRDAEGEQAASGSVVGVREDAVLLATEVTEAGVLRVPLANVIDYRLQAKSSRRNVGTLSQRIMYSCLTAIVLTILASMALVYTYAFAEEIPGFLAVAFVSAPFAGFVLGWIVTPWQRPLDPDRIMKAWVVPGWELWNLTRTPAREAQERRDRLVRKARERALRARFERTQATRAQVDVGPAESRSGPPSDASMPEG